MTFEITGYGLDGAMGAAMADIPNLTPDAVTVSAVGPASLKETVEVTGYESADLVLMVLKLTASASATFMIQGMIRT